MKKLFVLCLLFLGVSTVTFAQSKIEKRATQFVENLNSTIIKVDKSQKLTEEQRSKLNAVQVKRFTEIKNLGKSGSSDDKRAITKKHLKMNNKILTKKQKQANKKARKMKNR